MRIRWIVFFLFSASLLQPASAPAPKEHFGFTPGDDYKLADYSEIIGYFQKLERASSRIRLAEFGRTAEGKPMYIAFLSSPENLKKLDRYGEISRRLALGEPDPAEARRLAGEGKAIVWIDSGLHASEVAPAQHAPELAYRLVTEESAETEQIRRNVILLQVPVINPDGLDSVAHWYRDNVGTPYEQAPLPWLYQKYSGHDNNRDWYMLNLVETRAVTRLLFQEWFPQIVYNQHQAPPFPARIFVPPYAEPLNPNIPAAVMEGINFIGMAMKERFARENKPGVLSYHGYDAWWNGGLRSVPAFHNMHGIVTETASSGYASPRVYKASEFPARFTNGLPAQEPTVFYERPWLGAKWGLRDAIDYMLTADFALLDLAAARRSDYLLKSYELARAAIDAGRAGRPYAYVIRPEQWDRPTAMEMLERLALAGVQVQQAQAGFQAGGRQYPAGAYVLLAAQPFRPYLMDLLEPQHYPELKTGTTGPTKRPYDIAGWTLSLQMGVAVDRIDDPFEAALGRVTEPKAEGIVRGKGGVVTLDHRENNAIFAVNFLLGRQEPVKMAADGTLVFESAYLENYSKQQNFAGQFGITIDLRGQAPPPAYSLRSPRVALYQPWVANADQGWTQWLLDHFGIQHTLIHNDDFARDDLGKRFDSIILAAQSAQSILHGARDVEESADRGPERFRFIGAQRPRYAGGIGLEGLARLERFVRGGGTLIALDTATELPLEFFALPVRNLVRAGGSNQFYSPGSLLRVTVDPRHPLAFGMPRDAIVFSSGGEAFEITASDTVRQVASFAERNLLASGWVSGEGAVLGKPALVEARIGRGRVVLFGFRPQFRGQPFGTFKFLLNAIYLASAQPVS